MDVISTNVAAAPMRPGKSAQAVGHLAKAAVAEARAAGAELPKNAQGMAASAIARGAEPSSVFAALVVPDPAPEASVPEAEGETTQTPGDETTLTDATVVAQEGYSAGIALSGGGSSLSEAESALTLLEDAP